MARLRRPPGHALALSGDDRQRLAELWDLRDIDAILEFFRERDLPIPLGVYRAHVGSDEERWRDAEPVVLEALRQRRR